MTASMWCRTCRRPRPVHWYPPDPRHLHRGRWLPHPHAVCARCRKAAQQRPVLARHFDLMVGGTRPRWNTWADRRSA